MKLGNPFIPRDEGEKQMTESITAGRPSSSRPCRLYIAGLKASLYLCLMPNALTLSLSVANISLVQCCIHQWPLEEEGGRPMAMLSQSPPRGPSVLARHAAWDNGTVHCCCAHQGDPWMRTQISSISSADLVEEISWYLIAAFVQLAYRWAECWPSFEWEGY